MISNLWPVSKASAKATWPYFEESTSIRSSLALPDMLKDMVAALCWDDISFHISNPVWVEQPERTISSRIVHKQSIEKKINLVEDCSPEEAGGTHNKTVSGLSRVMKTLLLLRSNLVSIILLN